VNLYNGDQSDKKEDVRNRILFFLSILLHLIEALDVGKQRFYGIVGSSFLERKDE
jgi:hypothetical protein